MSDAMVSNSEQNKRAQELRRDLGFGSEDEKIIDLIMRYCSDPSRKSLTAGELESVERLIETDAHWKDVYRQLNEEYAAFAESISKSGIAGILAPVRIRGLTAIINEKMSGFFSTPTARYAIAAAASVVLLIACASILSRIVTPKSVALAKIGQESLTLRGSQHLPVEAVDAIHSGRYDEAIDRLTALTLARSDSEATAVDNYLLGIALLHSSERSILGFFPWYNHETVLEGMRHIQLSLRFAGSRAGRSDFQDACRFALGKAALMLDDVPKAQSYFLQVNERNNPYRMPARTIMSSLSR